MKRYDTRIHAVPRRPVDFGNKDLRMATSDVPDSWAILVPPCTLFDTTTGLPVLEARLDTVPSGTIHRTLDGVTHTNRLRQNGLATVSTTFGWLPRAMGRQRPACYPSRLDRDHPQALQALRLLAPRAERFYAERFPAVFAPHAEKAKLLVDGFRFANTVFTGGIVNQQSQLPYHKDGGNLPGAYSVMYVFRGYHRGGDLALPEYSTLLRCPDRTLVCFSGQDIIHGVTPIDTRDERYSVVFYSYAAIWRCLPVAEEVEQANTKRTEMERRRADARSPKQ